MQIPTRREDKAGTFYLKLLLPVLVPEKVEDTNSFGAFKRILATENVLICLYLTHEPYRLTDPLRLEKCFKLATQSSNSQWNEDFHPDNLTLGLLFPNLGPNL